MKLRILSIAITLFATTLVQSQEISDTSFGKGLINFVAKDSSFSVKFAPRFQVRSMSSWDHDGKPVRKRRTQLHRTSVSIKV